MTRDRSTDDVATAIAEVVANGNCSGCGGCAALFPEVRMAEDDRGFQRPVVSAAPRTPEAVARFRRVCPGAAVIAEPRAGRKHDDTVGDYVSVWAAWSTDDALRFAGSSGGVISALNAWLLETNQQAAVVGAAADPQRPVTTSVSIQRSYDDVLRAAGSRYAPVAMTEAFDADQAGSVFVGKPCETYAARQLSRVRAEDTGARSDGQPPPLLLSFFCAGTPSQHATRSLVATLGVDPETVTSLRYRGNGWPGRFAVADASGAQAAISYDESWGKHLGRQIQSRCRICPDGTGGHADIAVGDYWETDASGYPVFDDAPGTSVAIARTQRGHDLLLAAQQAGVLALQEITAASVAAIQPLQTVRRATLLGRVIGRRLGGYRVPRYRGYQLLSLGFRNPRRSIEFLRGTRHRARTERR
ncbi:Coenzyme F420 hydrogenase/dehydrogenase, beta subunit C-terminal domain [Jatrophihabitans telluris]|uniref:Coenzyme F420 hydrogenase/dehydrogenase, beta subunit C-terminal domain n=1 Tax=Jatrophihabitans telluris TaxID=2038343 RepID=A0ABY4R248_9ACTN|nr:Coenzyme F420 hydrogenase/dehydrogenase, beta subunit C-terminal domain [Jatrophihabitans telluris]UQX89361.1 Coenzyme F420 hydrogenase/dehydrogenase, beta subunit C-terminal domain [Jatrophihabitans telluris]